MAAVHVLKALPEGENVGFHERRCTDPDQGEERIYHATTVTFLDGSVVCYECGFLMARKGQMKKA